MTNKLSGISKALSHHVKYGNRRLTAYFFDALQYHAAHTTAPTDLALMQAAAQEAFIKAVRYDNHFAFHKLKPCSPEAPQLLTAAAVEAVRSYRLVLLNRLVADLAFNPDLQVDGKTPLAWSLSYGAPKCTSILLARPPADISQLQLPAYSSTQVAATALSITAAHRDCEMRLHREISKRNQPILQALQAKLAELDLALARQQHRRFDHGMLLTGIAKTYIDPSYAEQQQIFVSLQKALDKQKHRTAVQVMLEFTGAAKASGVYTPLAVSALSDFVGQYADHASMDLAALVPTPSRQVKQVLPPSRRFS